MATLKTTDVVHVREDLGNVISRISPEETPLLSSFAKTTASNTRHEFLTSTLNPPNGANASVEGAEFVDTPMNVPTRLANYTQISTKTVNVSGTLQAVNTAGTNDELSRQVIDAGIELKRDIETAIVGNYASNAGGAGVAKRSAGMEAWISTNVLPGTNGSSPGYNGNTVAAAVDGTLRPLTEAMFKEAVQKAWSAGGDVKKVIVGPQLKQAISAFKGQDSNVKYVESKAAAVNASVDLYTSDFGTHEIMAHRYMRERTVILFDPKLWAVATLRPLKKVDLPKSHDADRKGLITEWTLVSKNELGNAKISDVRPA